MDKEDNIVKTSFSAVVMFLDDGEEETFDVELSKPVEELAYDDVEFAFCDAVDSKYGFKPEDFEDDDPPYKIINIVVNDGDESYPVLSESDDDSEIKSSKVHSKYLVLPWAKYGLTPEAKLWMKMKDMHMVSEDEPFDFNKYHALVEDIDEKK